jgi:hypothetical protein
MARRKNTKRIDPRYFLNETVNRNDDGSRLEEAEAAQGLQQIANVPYDKGDASKDYYPMETPSGKKVLAIANADETLKKILGSHGKDAPNIVMDMWAILNNKSYEDVWDPHPDLTPSDARWHKREGEIAYQKALDLLKSIQKGAPAQGKTTPSAKDSEGEKGQGSFYGVGKMRQHSADDPKTGPKKQQTDYENVVVKRKRGYSPPRYNEE